MSAPSDQNDRAILEVVTPRSGTVGEVLTLAAPLIVSFVSFSLMGVVDTLVMGRVGTPEQGAVGLGGMLTWGLAVVFTATLTAVNTFVAQDYGAGNHHRVSSHVRTAAFLIPLFTVLVWATIPLLPAMIRSLGSDPTVAPHILAYMRIRIMGVPFLFINFTLTSFLRGLGDMRSPMVVTIIANIINAALTIWFVFGGWFVPALGVKGAALGSLIGGICEALMYLALYLGERRHQLYRTRSLGLPTLREIGRFLKVGMPIGFAWAFDMIAWMLFSIYASTLQPAALAAHMIIFQIIHFSFLPAAAVGVVQRTARRRGKQPVDDRFERIAIGHAIHGHRAPTKTEVVADDVAAGVFNGLQSVERRGGHAHQHHLGTGEIFHLNRRGHFVEQRGRRRTDIGQRTLYGPVNIGRRQRRFARRQFLQQGTHGGAEGVGHGDRLLQIVFADRLAGEGLDPFDHPGNFAA